MGPHSGKSRRVRLAVEGLEERDTPSSLTVSLGDGTHASAILTMETGAPGASGSIVGHAAEPSGVSGTIVLGSGRQ